MNATLFAWALIPIIAAGAIGVYLLLQPDDGGFGRRARWLGAGLAGISLMLIAAVTRTRADAAVSVSGNVGAPWSALNAFVLVLSGCGVSLAAAAITSAGAWRSGTWFLASLLVMSGVIAFQHTAILAIANVLIFGVAVLTVQWVLRNQAFGEIDGAGRRDVTEPLLAVVCGGLMLGAAMWSVHGMINVEAPHALDIESRGRPATLRLAAIPPPGIVERIVRTTSPNSQIASEERGLAAFAAAVFEEHTVEIVVAGVLLVVAAVGATLVTREFQ